MDDGFKKVTMQFNEGSGEIRDLNGMHVIFAMTSQDFRFGDAIEEHSKSETVETAKDNMVEKLTAIKALGYKLPDVIKLKEAGVL